MAIMAYILGGLISLFSFSGAPTHEFYLSYCDIDHNTQNQSLEITLKIFTEDLEAVLAHKGLTGRDLSQDAESADVREHLGAYFKEHLQLEVNGKEVASEFLGMETEEDITWAYLEVTEVTSFQTLRLTNSILMDLFDSQKNIIHVKSDTKKHSLLCEKDSFTQELSL